MLHQPQALSPKTKQRVATRPSTSRLNDLRAPGEVTLTRASAERYVSAIDEKKTTVRVLVLSKTLKPLMPCAPARARKLLRDGKAAVYRRQPFTIVLKERADGAVQPIEFKVDPGSKVTGLVLVAEFKRGRTVVWGANLVHRGHKVKAAVTDRAMFRRGRRGRKTRYRAARFDNRTRAAGWMPPSLLSRVLNVRSWYARLLDRAPIICAHVETVSFDTQLMENAEISGVEYQQGELRGYEVRQYVLARGEHTCAYCGKRDVPLVLDHVVARSRGGSDRASNLVPACRPCNDAKSNQAVEAFLADRPEVLARIKAQLRAPLKDAAVMNATRFAIVDALRAFGLEVRMWSGGRTKWNRTRLRLPKDHWIDAACVGESGAAVRVPALRTLTITATGRGHRRAHGNDRYGFPRGCPRRAKRVAGFQTGDLVRLVCPTGKSAGTHVGRLSSIRARGKFVLGKHDRPAREFTLLQRSDGYAYG